MRETRKRINTNRKCSAEHVAVNGHRFGRRSSKCRTAGDTTREFVTWTETKFFPHYREPYNWNVYRTCNCFVDINETIRGHNIPFAKRRRTMKVRFFSTLEKPKKKTPEYSIFSLIFLVINL